MCFKDGRTKSYFRYGRSFTGKTPHNVERIRLAIDSNYLLFESKSKQLGITYKMIPELITLTINFFFKW